MHKLLAKNIPKIYFFKFSCAFMILMPVMVPFFKSKGLNMEQVYQLQSLFALCMLILEVPSGYISDLFGRKNTLILGGIFHLIGYSIFPFSNDFLDLVIAEMALAMAVSLISGTDISLIYDSLEAIQSQKARIKITGRFLFYQQIGEAISGLLGGWFVLLSLQATVYAQWTVGILPLLVAFTLKEPERKKLSKESHKNNFKLIYKVLFKESKLLHLIVLNAIVYGSSTLIAVWSFQEYWQKMKIPLIYFGYLWALSNLTVALTARFAHKIEKKITSSGTLILLALLPILGFWGMGQVSLWWGIIFCLLFQISRGLNGVVIRDALNKRVSGEMRATANSISSLGVRVVFIFLGPLMGYLIDEKSISFAFQSFSGIYFLLFFIFTIPLLKLRGDFRTGN